MTDTHDSKSREDRDDDSAHNCNWPLPAVATGVGPMPGIDAHEAMNVVAGELGDFVHLIELPDRGPGADLLGRAACLLAEADRSFEVETTPSGWRVGHAGSSVMRRARNYVSQDIDALEEFTVGYAGPLKVAIAGPWSLAAGIADPAGESLIRDPGAASELAAGMAETAQELTARVARAVPGAAVVIEIIEDVIPSVLEGRIKMSSGRLTHRSVEAVVVQSHLRTVVEGVHAAGARASIRCFAPRAPIDLLVGTGADAVSVNLGLALPNDESLPRAWESGVGLLLGCVPVSVNVGQASDTAVSATLREFMSRNGFADVPANIALTPQGGLAGVDMSTARAIIGACRRVGSIVRDDLETTHAS